MNNKINYIMESTTLTASKIDKLVKRLEEILSGEQIKIGAEVQRSYPGDMSWLTIIHAHHGKLLNRPDVVVVPTTTEQVSEIMKLANELEVPVTPLGGGSGVQGAANANCGGVQIDLGKMSSVRKIDLNSMSCTVEPGLIVKEFEELLNKQGLSFTHYPASAEWASVGGSVAARGSGVLSTKYGNIQDHVLSLEVVLPSGDIVNLPDVPKHGAGPEMTQLFIGSEGALGIITAIRVKLRNLPVKRIFKVFSFDTLGKGINAGREIMVTGLRPSVMRLYDKNATLNSLNRAVNGDLEKETMIIMVDGDHERMIELEADICAELCEKHGGKALDYTIGERWWTNRYAFYHPPYAPELPQMWCTLDAVCDFSNIEKLYNNVTEAIKTAAGPEMNLSLKTHLSHWFDWGSMIYPRVIIPEVPGNLEDALELHDKIVKAATLAAIDSGGVLNDHHGVGMRLAPYMQNQFGESGMELLKGIKRGLDPNNILCPGKLGLP